MCLWIKKCQSLNTSQYAADPKHSELSSKRVFERNDYYAGGDNILEGGKRQALR